jgi:hypothetical protein
MYRNAGGFYTVCLATKKGDCWDEKCTGIYILVNVNELEDLGISIYPNPSSGLFTIENKNNEEYQLHVFIS